MTLKDVYPYLIVAYDEYCQVLGKARLVRDGHCRVKHA